LRRLVPLSSKSHLATAVFFLAGQVLLSYSFLFLVIALVVYSFLSPSQNISFPLRCVPRNPPRRRVDRARPSIFLARLFRYQDFFPFQAPLNIGSPLINSRLTRGLCPSFDLQRPSLFLVWSLFFPPQILFPPMFLPWVLPLRVGEYARFSVPPGFFSLDLEPSLAPLIPIQRGMCRRCSTFAGFLDFPWVTRIGPSFQKTPL